MSFNNRCQSLKRIFSQAYKQTPTPLIELNASGTRLSPTFSVRHFSLLCQVRRATCKQQQQQQLFISIQLPNRTQKTQQRRFFNSGTQVPRPYVDPKLSYAYGKSNEHLIYSTVARELDRRVSESPDELAVISHEENIEKTYRQLNGDLDKLCKSLVSKFNIQKGDTIGVFAYNCYNWILIQYACSRIGAILTPINPSYKGAELAYILRTGKVKCLFLPGFKSIQRELNDHMAVLQSQSVLEMLEQTSSSQPLLKSVILIDEENDYNLKELNSSKLANFGCKLFHWSDTQTNDGRVFKSAQAADEANVRPEDACILSPELVAPDDLFAIYYTSGTTGKPKGACCSQFTVINNVRLCQIRLRQGRPRNLRVTAACTLPMFHIFAGVLNALSPMVSNSCIVLASHKYDIQTFVESIQKHQANITTLTPTMLIDMLTYIEQRKINDLSLKIIQPGGASLAPELVARTFKALPHLEEIRTGYGSSENGAVATFQTIHEPEATRAHTVGPPLDFTEVRIVKPTTADENGENSCLPLGEKGEIQTRGHNVMVEYLNQPDKTREVITQERWYRTGDIGFMHPHGSIEISGRLKHMIIKGGENIYPEEVEQMMHKMACIEKVHVVGVPDERFGEQVCAWVKLAPGFCEAGDEGHQKAAKGEEDTNDKRVVCKEDIIKFCKENITYFKVPKYLLFVDDFPMTPTKKVQNHVMVEQSIEILGLANQKRQQQKQ